MDPVSLIVGIALPSSAVFVKWISELGRNKRTSLEIAARDPTPARITAETASRSADDTQRIAMYNMQAEQNAKLSSQLVTCWETIFKMGVDSREANKDCEKRLIDSDKRCGEKLAVMSVEIHTERQLREDLETQFEQAEIARIKERADAAVEIEVSERIRADAERRETELVNKLRARELDRVTPLPIKQRNDTPRDP